MSLKRWLPAILWTTFILVLSSMPGADFSSVKSENFTIRKILHLVEYAVLCLAFYRAVKKPYQAVLLSILVSVLDELRQSFIPTRTGKISDILIDSSSVILTGIVLWRYFQNLPMTLKNWLKE